MNYKSVQFCFKFSFLLSGYNLYLKKFNKIRRILNNIYKKKFKFICMYH